MHATALPLAAPAASQLPVALPGRSLTLASCNILAGGRMSGYRDYVTQGWRHVLPHGKRENLQSLARLLGEFDLVGLQEADAGSLRSGFLNQTQYLAQAAAFPFWSHQPNRRVSRLASSANGLLARQQPDEVVDYPLPGRIPGRGALFVRFGSGQDELVVVIAHLSLGQVARARQLAFIAELVGNHPRVVLMGDLNTSAQSAELDLLYARTRLAPPEDPPPSFPSWRPTRAIDHIITSSELEVVKRWALPHPVSDHLPVAARIRLPEPAPGPVRRPA